MMLLPLNLYSQVLASLLAVKIILDDLTKSSNIINPMLWRVFSYSSPMLPKPTIRYFNLLCCYFLSVFAGAAFAGAAFAAAAAGVAAAASATTATALVTETVATTILGVSKN